MTEHAAFPMSMYGTRCQSIRGSLANLIKSMTWKDARCTGLIHSASEYHTLHPFSSITTVPKDLWIPSLPFAMMSPGDQCLYVAKCFPSVILTLISADFNRLWCHALRQHRFVYLNTVRVHRTWIIVCSRVGIMQWCYPFCTSSFAPTWILPTL